jgi:1,2-beta-oligoglucan phosphorylase
MTMTVDNRESQIPDNQNESWADWKQTQESDLSITNGDVRIVFTEFGDIASISSGELQISQYAPGAHDAGIAGIWLRRHDQSGIVSVPLIGVRSRSSWGLSPRTAVWEGSDLGVSWTVTLAIDPHAPTWAWHVDVNPQNAASASAGQAQWDIVTDQDLALAPKAQALTSEPYISQYVTYRSVDLPDYGRVVAARQTMSCAPALPLLVSAIKEGAQAHLTDGFDFYGKNARLGAHPQMLDNPTWDGGFTNQYEFGMIALLSAPQKSAPETGERHLEWTQVFAFDPDFRGEMPEACEEYTKRAFAGLDDVLRDASSDAPSIQLTPAGHAKSSDAHAPSLLATAPVLDGDDLDDDAFLSLGEGVAADQESDESGHVLSYFADRASHVVSKAKELLVSRSHGQILLAGSVQNPEHPVLATTSYAPGVFASHIVFGNTNMNRLISVQRTSLNLLRSQGMRILVRRNDQWQVLGVPSAFVMELGASKWIYRFGEQSITVTVAACAHRDALELEFESSEAMDVMLTADVEFPENWSAELHTLPGNASAVEFSPESGSSIDGHCPGLRYVFASSDATIGGDGPLFGLESSASEGTAVLTFSSAHVTGLRLAVAASMEGSEAALECAGAVLADETPLADELQAQFEYINGFMDDFSISDGGRLNEWNEGAPWFVQNALVHFLSPHGLEQYSGAAWGTRDVCQGPFEMALAFGHFDIAHDIILKVFGHQNPDGSLPQWFMFDEYAEMFQHDSHGDIPVWPLMAVYEYLEAGGDRALLEEQVDFWDDVERTTGKPTVADHLEQTLDYIRTHRVPGTELFCYGEGDWDDTLQPAQQSMKKEMASTWTIALLFQATTALHRLLKEVGYDDLAHEFDAEAQGIKQQFAKNFIYDDVLAGYVVFTDDGPMPVIHPEDTRTGLHYRLIPMTRSIIAGLLTPEGAQNHEQLIEEHLHYPDGVRLMNRPAHYQDGITTYFKRGEQAANIGREIGLMYTHAHIRYTEALSQLGRDSVAEELLRISPVNQFKRLDTSEIRQRNCYFASSDADFPDRYTAADQWDRLKADAKDPIGVRGGWRVYSSGPGIYLRQMVQHVFGLQLHTDSVSIDPILQLQDDGVSVQLSLFGSKRTLRYHLSDDDAPVTVSVGGRRLDADAYDLPYRRGGLVVGEKALEGADVIDISVGVHRSTI